ncbi:related to dihydrodipicolinate synthetase family protein [Melanopsichium pennsylvanicum]|uniref:Related to dihydrodipicolinate synthetase family protein n=2 Tax=Melanopsichium pennsylvanicum TaxID=63383 RepID=A0AAJ4XRC9_9BASI|nr:dihydrodipicolinate synthetase [Melanopsichium pennsylvanicum 4]SNX86962.1 related to dihydrodipicolinate synthetase family protein [Melanopsichium pennsylvanicum]
MTQTTNGYQPTPLAAGVWTPLATPFKPHTEELDLASFRTHVARVASAGSGLVIMGTNGEAIHLSASERFTLVSVAREHLSSTPGLSNTQIIAGTGVASVKETISNCIDAARAGADAAIVILPGYFAGGLGKDRKAMVQFFTAVADKSPIPIMVYNFPACVGGIDLDSDLIIEICQHPNVCGAKLTCASIGKGMRIAAAVQRPGFHVWSGFADIILPATMAGFNGVIAGSGNIIPRTLVKLYNLIQQATHEKNWEKLQQAQQLQKLVSHADWVMFKSGIPGTKTALTRWYYEYGVCRLPLQPATKEVQHMLETELQDIIEFERSLEREAGVTPAKA